MPARRASSPRRDLTAVARTPNLVGLRGTLEHLEDRNAPAVFTATQDPGQFGANNAAAVTEVLGFFATAAKNGEQDTINLFPNAVYTFNASAESLADGDNAIPSIVADGPGRNGVTLNGNGATITRNSGAGAFRLLRVNGSAATTYLNVNDITITAGSSTNGGAILAKGGAPLTVNNSTLGNNTAIFSGVGTGNGGAVALQGGSGATFNNVNLNGNVAATDGGGINLAAAAFVQFNNSRIINNTSTNGVGGASGSTGSFEFNDSTLSNNSGKTVGAFGGTDAVFNRDAITNNNATAGGTGGVSSGSANIRVVQSYVANNNGQLVAGSGGGISGNVVTVLSSTVDQNSTGTGGGGGIFGTTVDVENSTVTRNFGGTAATGGGGIQATTLAMTHTIAANNTPDNTNGTPDVLVTGAGSTSNGFNLIATHNAGNSKFNLAGGDRVGGTATDKRIDPLLGPAQANGGPTFTRALGVGSTAINAGNIATGTITTDQRGFGRKVGSNLDIGAFEVQAGNAVGIISGDHQTIATNKNFANDLKVLVTDPNGTKLANTIVKFQAPTTPDPTASAIFFGNGPVTGILTDFNGFAAIAAANATANATAGDYFISVATNNGAPATNFSLRNTAFTVTIPTTGSLQIVSGNNQSTTANALFSQNLKVQVLDTNNVPIANVPVTFTAPNTTTAPSLTFSNGGSTITVNTDASGFVSIPGTADTVASTNPFQVEATGPNVGTVTFDLVNRPAVASKVSVSSGAGQATLTNSTFSSPLQALVTDTFGNPVLAGVSVTYAGPSSGAGVTFTSQTFTTVLTNASGIASALPTANGTGGSYFVDATVMGGAQMASFNLSNIFVPPPPPPPPPPPNANPIITDVADQMIVNGNSGTFSFGVSDAESAPSNLVVSAKSSNTSLIPSLTFGGSGINRTVTVNTAAGQMGTAVITLTVTDESGATANDTFNVNVTVPPPPPPPPPMVPSNTPPVISDITNQTLSSGQTGQYGVVVVDAETAASNLVVTASAANTTLIPAVTITGSGSNRVVNVVSAAGQSGTTTITVSVRDTDNNVSTDTFNVTVPPTTIPPPPPPPALPTVPLVGTPQFAVGSGPGGAQVVRFFNADGTERFLASAFPGLTGGVRTATGDFNGDGVADVVIGTGPGSSTQVQILDGSTGATLFQMQPFESTFTGGVYVAAGDLNGDGRADLVITPDEGGGPRARVLSGNGFGVLADFFAIDDTNFRGGARAALGDVNGDGRSDLIVSAGFGGGPRIAGFDGTSIGGAPRKLFADFFLFEQGLRNGAFIAVGDLNGDGFADIIGGGGPGGGPRVFALSGQSLLTNTINPLANFFVGDTGDRGGVRVSVKNLDNDLKADLVVGSGEGSGNHVTGFLGSNITAGGTPLSTLNLDTFPGFTGGVFVG